MSRSLLPPILTLTGVVAVVISFLLPMVLNGAGWSESHAEELAQASTRIQQLAGKISKAKTPKERTSLTEQLAEQEKVIANMQSQLEGALHLGDWMAWGVRILGAIAVGGGFYLHATLPTASEPEKPAKTLSEMDPDYVPPEEVDITALDYTKAVRQSKAERKSRK